MEEFLLGNVLDAVVSQVMILLKERNLKLFHEISEEIKTLSLYGDQIRLQLVLSDFLLNVVHHAPSPDGWVEIRISPGLKLIQDGNEFVCLQFRYHNYGGLLHQISTVSVNFCYAKSIVNPSETTLSNGVILPRPFYMIFVLRHDKMVHDN